MLGQRGLIGRVTWDDGGEDRRAPATARQLESAPFPTFLISEVLLRDTKLRDGAMGSRRAGA